MATKGKGKPPKKKRKPRGRAIVVFGAIDQATRAILKRFWKALF